MIIYRLQEQFGGNVENFFGVLVNVALVQDLTLLN